MIQALRSRAQFLLLAALFFGPLLAAVGLYFVFPQWAPQARTNYGELINPARPTPEAAVVNFDGKPLDAPALRGSWSYVYLGGDGCDARCEEKLFQIRQIRTLLNEKRTRVQRVYIAPTLEAAAQAHQQLASVHPDMVFYADTPDAELHRFFGGEDAQAVYLVDPLGNWLMVYPADAEYKGILKDIKKLLKISQIG